MNVYILLDRSGSMGTLWGEALGSINAYVTKLKKKDKVYLSVFDDQYEVIRDCAVEDWKDVTDADAMPRGVTALYDSCGKIMAQAEKDDAKKTMLVVMTDGYENASKEFTQAAIKAKVAKWEDKKWEVVFLGANFDSVESVSGAIGVVAGKTLNYGAGQFMRGMETLACSSVAYADHGTAVNFSFEDKANLQTSD